MRVINFQIVFSLLMIILLSSCASTKYFMQSALSEPRVTYRQGSVEISYEYFAEAYRSRETSQGIYGMDRPPFAPGSTIFLNAGGETLSQGVFELARGRSQGSQVIKAKIRMPQKYLLTYGDTCFSLSDDGNNLVPIDDDEGSEGFINDLWQSKIANPRKKVELANINGQKARNIANLPVQKQNALNYVKTSGMVVGDQCILPEHSYAEPKAPFSHNIQRVINSAPYAACRDVKVGNLTLKANTNLVSIYLNSLARSRRSEVETASKFLESDIYNGKFDSKLVSDVGSIMSEGMKVKECTARSVRCSIYEELLFGNPVRQYLENYKQCVGLLDSRFALEISGYRSKHNEWKSEPGKRKKHCVAQLDLLANYDQLLENEHKVFNETGEAIENLNDKGIFDYSGGDYGFAKDSTCGI